MEYTTYRPHKICFPDVITDEQKLYNDIISVYPRKDPLYNMQNITLYVKGD